MIIRIRGSMPQTLSEEWNGDRVRLFNNAGICMFDGTRWLLNQCFARGWFE